MSIKKKFTSMLFGQKAGAVDGAAPAAPETAGVASPETVTGGRPDSYVLELSSEHPLYRLYDQRRL